MKQIICALGALCALSCAAELDENAMNGGEPVAQHTSELSSDYFRVLTLNVRIPDPKPETGLESFATRLPRIRTLIRDINPDIIGLQEVVPVTWASIKASFPDYHRVFWERGGLIDPHEGVALLVRGSRFTVQGDPDERTFNPTTSPNRNVGRLKLEDKVTGRILDVFVTHGPTGGDNRKERFAEFLSDWVENYGANALLMGDFNTGYEKSGDRESPYQRLLSTSSVPLYNVHTSIHGAPQSGDSFNTGSADEPETRTGRMIDHIMFGPAYRVAAAEIDRSLFSGSTLVNCDDDNSRWSGGTRSECRAGSGSPVYLPVSHFKSYSDHWAVWADLKRVDCPNGC